MSFWVVKRGVGRATAVTVVMVASAGTFTKEGKALKGSFDSIGDADWSGLEPPRREYQMSRRIIGIHPDQPTTSPALRLRKNSLL
jgi:hypothetical protein